MGRPKSLRHDGPEGQSGRRPKGLPKNRRSLVNLSGPPLRPEHSLRAPATSGQSLRPERPGPEHRFLLRPRISDRGPHREAAYHSSPTGAARADWGHPTEDARSEGTRGKRRRQCTKSNHDTGTISCTPAGTVLLNRHDTNSIVGTDICVYSIVGAIGLPYGKKAPHIPLGIDSGC